MSIPLKMVLMSTCIYSWMFLHSHFSGASNLLASKAKKPRPLSQQQGHKKDYAWNFRFRRISIWAASQTQWVNHYFLHQIAVTWGYAPYQS
jgi:hypothetical protein